MNFGNASKAIRSFFWGMAAAGLAFLPNLGAAENRPNIVWILSEDNSKDYLKLYEESGAETPAIEALAREGLTFTHAFSSAPVCSPARTTLMTGVYAPRICAEFHRPLEAKPSLPNGLKMFPAYLREAGYYTTNRSKTDYNVNVGGDVWDKSSPKASWRDRPTPETPFFHMETTMVSHEGKLHFRREEMESHPLPLDSIKLPPFYPDTELFRYTYARYLRCMKAVDNVVDHIVSDLKKDGLLDNTIIFYFGDNGGTLPGSKGYIYDRGLHIPLVVRFPEKWAGLSPFKLNERVKGFVSEVDFAPTVLNLANVKIPEGIDGRAFLGRGVTAADVDGRDTAFSYANRFDEQYNFSRALRKGRYKYIRHYTPFYPDGLYSAYRFKTLAMSEWRDLFRAGKLDEMQSAFFLPKPPEAFYDIESDPFELHNFAKDPKYAKNVEELRKALDQQLRSMPDLGFYPESVLIEKVFPDIAAFSKEHRGEIARLIDIADLQLKPYAEIEKPLQAALASNNPMEQYWALIVASSFGAQASGLTEKILPLAQSDNFNVALRAAEFLAIEKNPQAPEAFQRALDMAGEPAEMLLALNSAVYLRDYLGLQPDLSGIGKKKLEQNAKLRVDYLLGKKAPSAKSAKKKKRKSKQ